MKKNKITPVIFLIEKLDENEFPQTFAFFPEEKYSYRDDNIFMSYAHIGQHSACHIEYANACKPAAKEQYNDLLQELIGQGYDNLKILNSEK